MPSKPTPQEITVVLTGLEQKADAKVRRPDALERAENVEFDKEGALSKRLGYRRVSLENVVGLDNADEVAMHLAKRRGELLVITHDTVIALGSQESGMRDVDAFVYRGPCNRGAIRGEFVSTSRLGRDNSDGEDTGP